MSGGGIPVAFLRKQVGFKDLLKVFHESSLFLIFLRFGIATVYSRTRIELIIVISSHSTAVDTIVRPRVDVAANNERCKVRHSGFR